MSVWNTVQGIANLQLECNLCSHLSTPTQNNIESEEVPNARVSMKKITMVKNDGSKSPPHGGKKRRETIRAPSEDHSLLGPPWVRRNYCYGMVGFHEEIEDFYNFMKPTDEERRMREHVIDSVRETVLKLWPSAKVEVFGSFRTNLYLPTSDIDIVLFGQWECLPLFTLKEALTKNKIADEASVKVLDRAAVPIIKFQHLHTKVKVDISFNQESGVQSVQLIKDYIEKYPVLPKLIFVLKQFLLLRDLNEVWTGGVSSYAIIIMCISFLQLHPRRDARLPTANVAVLLVEFFELYGRHFNYYNTCIRIKNGGRYIQKEEFQRQMDRGCSPSLLSIEDPLTRGNDLGRGSYAVLQVKQAFDFAYRTLTSAIIQYKQKFAPVSLLGLVVNVSDGIVEFRASAHERWRLHQESLNATKPASSPPPLPRKPLVVEVPSTSPPPPPSQLSQPTSCTNGVGKQHDSASECDQACQIRPAADSPPVIVVDKSSVSSNHAPRADSPPTLDDDVSKKKATEERNNHRRIEFGDLRNVIDENKIRKLAVRNEKAAQRRSPGPSRSRGGPTVSRSHANPCNRKFSAVTTSSEQRRSAAASAAFS